MKKIKKTKVRKEDRNLIKETVNSIAAMRLQRRNDDNEIEMEELDGLVRTDGGSSSGSRRAGGSSKNEAVWKTLAFCMFGILMLFATDVIEFKKYTNDDDKSMNHSSSNKHAEAETTHEILVGSVELKPAAEIATSRPAEKDADPPSPNPAANATPAPEAKKEDPPANSGTTTGERRTYKTRGQPMSDEDRKAMEDKWGKWTLEPDNKDRPTDDYYAAYPNRDVPFDEFPSNAWQTDKEWLSKFLPESISLVDRAMKAILEEYEQPLDGTSGLFHLEKYDEWLDGMDKKDCAQQVGCTTVKSFENLKRRLLHAVMSEDLFVFAMGGHSASAGHGNHFVQSYTLQVQWILEGVFSRLGVRHQARNIALGGLGTTQTGIATKQIIGHDVDVLMWDSGMTEPEPEARDMFFRQGILGAGKVPMIVAMSPRNDVIRFLNKEADADIVMLGEAEHSLTKTETLEEVAKLPWAAQYVQCGSEISGICRKNEYDGVCWIEREDFTPTTKQSEKVGGRAKWHPGNRHHQIKGRAIAFMILEALKESLTMWNEAEDYKLADDTWHVTSLYDNTRSKVENLGPDVGTCKKYEKKFSSIMCNTAIKARVEFTPRAYPDFTNIRTLMPPTMAEHINDPPETIYESDVFNQNLHPPAGAVDVLNIIEAGTPYTPILVPDYTHFYPKPKFEKDPTLPVGKGFQLATYAGSCDGSVDSWCKRQDGENCLLYGHNDGRNGIDMDSYSGWMVTNLPEFKHGFIAVKVETWHGANTNKATHSWKSINNERRELTEERKEPFLRSSPSNWSESTTTLNADEERQLGGNVPPYCDDFRFEWAIDGKVQSRRQGGFVGMTGHIQRVVEVVKIAEDPDLTGGVEKEVELAFRITGCERKKVMRVTHIYWA